MPLRTLEDQQRAIRYIFKKCSNDPVHLQEVQQ
mgnify:CR=1 FL=1